MGWLIALGILVLLALLPIGVSAVYDSEGAIIRILAGPVRFQVFPLKKKGPKKEKKPKKDRKASPAPKASKTSVSSEAPKPKKKGGSITDFLPLVKMGLDMLGDLRRKLRVEKLYLNMVLAGDDPCDMAVNYGKLCAAMGNLWPRLEELFVIKKRDVQLQCDFESTQTLVTAQLDITITVGRLIATVLWHGIKILFKLLSILNKQKGGAAT